jgi:hypothetical protein
MIPQNNSPSQLIRAAFEQARRSGKPDWHRMTIAVLKNRLLSLTNGQFRETDFGAQTLQEFVRLGSDVACLDLTGRLPAAVFLGDNLLVELPEPQRFRIRPDLWRAVLDYSRHSPFVWDQGSNQARVKLVTDDLPAMPTVTEAELREWRKAFIDRHSSGLDTNTLEQLRNWQERILPSKILPRRLAEVWFAEMSEKVVARLRSWFAEHAIAEPPDLVQPIYDSKPQGRDSVEKLRRLVIACVNVMTDQELSALRFSPEILLRAIQDKTKYEN